MAAVMAWSMLLPFMISWPHVVQDDQFGVGPPLRHLPRGVQRPAEVVAAVDEHTGDALEPVEVVEDVVRLDERLVAPVVAHGPREPVARDGVGVPRAFEVVVAARDRGQVPLAPVPGGLLPDRRIRRVEEPVVGQGQVAVAIFFGNAFAEGVEVVREEHAEAAGDPRVLLGAGGGHRRDDDLADPGGVLDGVGEDQGGAPGTMRPAATSRCRGVHGASRRRRSGAGWCCAPCRSPDPRPTGCSDRCRAGPRGSGSSGPGRSPRAIGDVSPILGRRGTRTPVCRRDCRWPPSERAGRHRRRACPGRRAPPVGTWRREYCGHADTPTAFTAADVCVACWSCCGVRTSAWRRSGPAPRSATR